MMERVLVLGVEIPRNKPLWISLRYIYGVGPHLATKICKDLGIDSTKRAFLLTDEELSSIQRHLQENYLVEGDLRRKVQSDIRRLISIRCYRGTRHRLGLPVRGQRTRTNSRTRKGKRKTVAGKKG